MALHDLTAAHTHTCMHHYLSFANKKAYSPLFLCSYHFLWLKYPFPWLSKSQLAPELHVKCFLILVAFPVSSNWKYPNCTFCTFYIAFITSYSECKLALYESVFSTGCQYLEGKECFTNFGNPSSQSIHPLTNIWLPTLNQVQSLTHSRGSIDVYNSKHNDQK